MTGVMSGVSASLAVYLLGHPDVNDFFTGLQGLAFNIALAASSPLNCSPMVSSGSFMPGRKACSRIARRRAS